MGINIQTVIDGLISPVARLENTVDTLKFGQPDTEVTGIMIAFMPTQFVIEQAIRRGANLIIAHEGPFFSHHDDTAILKNDPVYEEKRRLLETSGIALFRFHDYLHRYTPDGIMEGLIQKLDWMSYVQEHHAAYSILQIPIETVSNIAEHVKKRLGITFVRAHGNREMACSKIGLLAGYRGGGHNALPLFEREQLDLIMYGEGPEWETPEYVRDAVHQGRHKALIVLGHAESEEPGMEILANKLRSMYSEIPVHYVKEKPIFQVL
ncbi:Nif3-like dinuclear metal center hexameric protein [Paenibacillus qinlingensis]|uniref:Nif3-like dinuclear metal center hexameric protein n=1 Tax=Paenibacillus qinlingensis TaxID=1837343 RepID=UPI0015652B27|nr:Nif3-like dinuclear metal center hexameric protein [Paenibacillus qinlingensis]NQX58205.1 Nif3-like dinuclear metal center hexameric protein [Paenibacillus qinlingensis]